MSGDIDGGPVPSSKRNEEFERWLERELTRVNDETQWMAWYQLLCWTLDPINGISRERASMAFMQISRARAENASG